MIAPGSALAALVASIVVSAHTHTLATTPTPLPRGNPLGVVPARLDTDAQRLWRRAIGNDDTDTLRALLERHGDERALIDVRAATGKSALMVACKVGDPVLVQRLVARGASVDEVTHTGGTPFMFAVLGDRLDIARWLHGHQVDVDARGSNGWSAITIAAAKGLDDTLGWLLSIGVEPDRPDVYGFTPLMRAVDNQHAEAARRLIEAGVRVNATDESGNTALHHAVASGSAELVALLLDHGADATIVDREGLTPADLVSSANITSGGRTHPPLPASLVERLTSPAGAEN